jgi:hypothetical protein
VNGQSMNSEQLRRAIANDSLLSTFVWGVIARNDLELFPLFPGAYILNSDDRGLPGTHWLALFVTSQGKVEFFDPLAKTPSHYKLMLDCLYNTEVIQPSGSELCGLYVLFFLYWRCRGFSMNQITDSFNGSNNDALVLAHYATMSGL